MLRVFLTEEMSPFCFSRNHVHLTKIFVSYKKVSTAKLVLAISRGHFEMLANIKVHLNAKTSIRNEIACLPFLIA